MIKKSALLLTIFLMFSIFTIAEDTDGDGLDDVWERMHFPDLTETGNNDNDNDGLTNLEEQSHKSNPTKEDTDGDGFSDKQEIEEGTSPLFDTDKPLAVNFTLIMVILILVLAVLVFLYLKTKKPHAQKQDKIAEYIKSCEGKGFTDDQIKQELVKSGYKIEQIKKYF